MMSMTDDALNYRKWLAQEIRDKRDGADPDALAVSYLDVYGLRIPSLADIDRQLQEEGTRDVITAIDVLDSIVAGHPACCIIKRLYHGQNSPPDDKAIEEAIKAECTALRSHKTAPMMMSIEGLPPLPNMQPETNRTLADANTIWRNQRLLQLEALQPERVREIWVLCQVMGFSPFQPNDKPVS